MSEYIKHTQVDSVTKKKKKNENNLTKNRQIVSQLYHEYSHVKFFPIKKIHPLKIY